MTRLRPALLFLLALSLVPFGSCARQRPTPNVLLIVVDTLRADHVGGRNGKPSLTPNLDRLAAECVVFDHAQSPRAKTTPAVATLMTGLYPHDHNVRDLTTPMEADLPLWAEAFQTGGYRTGAIIGNYVLQDQLSGLARGFDLWVEDLPDQNGVPPSNVPMRGATSITDGLLCALGLGDPSTDGAGPRKPMVQGNQPWFLWAHYMDPHGAYEPPAPFRSAALSTVQLGAEPIPNTPVDEDAFHKRWVAEYNIPEDARLADGTIDAGVMRALYGGEVSHTDAEIGRLIDALRSSGQLENTIVIVTADHGESLGEHDYWFEHGRYAYEATCRVPLLVRFPEVLRDAPPPGIRHGDISLADLKPTLTELCWLPRGKVPTGALSSIRGRSRANLMRADRASGLPVFSEKVERAEKTRAVQAKAVRIGDWKFIRRYTHMREGPGREAERRLVILSEELYDLSIDPAEANNLIDAPGDAPMEELQTSLLEFSSADRHFAELARQLQKRREDLGREDPETLRALRALGY